MLQISTDEFGPGRTNAPRQLSHSAAKHSGSRDNTSKKKTIRSPAKEILKKCVLKT